MPRYFFHTEDGRICHDLEGTELAGPAAAKAEAKRFAAALLMDRSQELWETARWRLVVADEQGTIVITIEVAAIVGSALVD